MGIVGPPTAPPHARRGSPWGTRTAHRDAPGYRATGHRAGPHWTRPCIRTPPPGPRRPAPGGTVPDEVRVVDRVSVGVENLDRLDAYTAIPTVRPLVAVFVAMPGGEVRHEAVHGFSAAGHPLVLGADRRALVEAWRAPSRDEHFAGVEPDPERPGVTGPFTPAPAGMVAVFDDGRSVPAPFYDRYGRVVLLGDDACGRELYLAGDDPALVRIHIPGPPGQPGSDGS